MVAVVVKGPLTWLEGWAVIHPMYVVLVLLVAVVVDLLLVVIVIFVVVVESFLVGLVLAALVEEEESLLFVFVQVVVLVLVVAIAEVTQKPWMVLVLLLFVQQSRVWRRWLRLKSRGRWIGSMSWILVVAVGRTRHECVLVVVAWDLVD